MKVNQYYDVEIPREFSCRNCKKDIYVNDIKDKRCVYCSKQCEKQYWRLESKKTNYMKNRGKEYTTLRNYSNKEFALKVYNEKKEYKEALNTGYTKK